MGTSDSLMALWWFIAQIGKPDSLLSDYASQFKATSKLIDAVWIGTLKIEEVKSYVANERIHWSFIVELAPWMGDSTKD